MIQQHLVVGLATNDKVIAKIQYEAWQRQSEYAMQEIDNILKQTNTKPKELTKVIVTNGPGSYTGIRIALTIAKVLSLALNIPVCCLSSLQAICGVEGTKLALIDARSKRVYVGGYKQGQNILKDQIMTIDEVKEFLANHNEYEAVGANSVIDKEQVYVDYVENMFQLGKIMPNCEDVDALVPIYLKEAL